MQLAGGWPEGLKAGGILPQGHFVNSFTKSPLPATRPCAPSHSPGFVARVRLDNEDGKRPELTTKGIQSNSKAAAKACAQLASRQYGVITKPQALTCGLGRRSVGRRLESGSWSQMYPNVYLIEGAPLSWMAKMIGAVLGAGHTSAATHRAAAYLLGLDGFRQTVIEITSPKRIRWEGVISHRGPQLLSQDIRTVRGIPTATATHTLLSVGAVAGADRVEAALDSALVQGLTSLSYLENRLRQSSSQTGRSTAALKRFLEVRLNGQPPTESELERLYHRSVTQPQSLPTPIFQFHVPGSNRRIDFAYSHIRLGVEVLGWKVHGAFVQWHRDMGRHNELVNLGWEMLYFPWTIVREQPGLVAAQVRAAIQRLTPTLFVDK